jgi:hypothetical protein
MAGKNDEMGICCEYQKDMLVRVVSTRAVAKDSQPD